MKLRSALAHVAALAAAAACTSSTPTADTASTSDAGVSTDAGPGDADAGGPVAIAPGCGGCNCGAPKVPQSGVTPSAACAIADQGTINSPACNAYCAGLNEGAVNVGYFCTLPQDYATAFASARAQAGDAGVDAGADAGGICPAWTDTVVIQCGYPCLGRRTAGISDPAPADAHTIGSVFASRAYLEAVSVHAFARLERELAFHGAPLALRRRARRSRRDEVRHTAMTTRVARRFGAEVRSPAALADEPPRSLFEIARENVVEGCVRETYGAVMGLIEAAASSDPEVRSMAELIARDECRHAELAVDVAGWLAPRLSLRERARVRRAAADAIADLDARGDRAVVELMRRHVWSAEDATRTWRSATRAPRDADL